MENPSHTNSVSFRAVQAIFWIEFNFCWNLSKKAWNAYKTIFSLKFKKKCEFATSSTNLNVCMSSLCKTTDFYNLHLERLKLTTLTIDSHINPSRTRDGSILFLHCSFYLLWNWSLFNFFEVSMKYSTGCFRTPRMTLLDETVQYFFIYLKNCVFFLYEPCMILSNF